MEKVFYISYDLIRGKNETKEEYIERYNKINERLIDDYDAKIIQRSLLTLKLDESYDCDSLKEELLNFDCIHKTDRLIIIEAIDHLDHNSKDELYNIEY